MTYLKEEITHEPLPDLGLKLYFASVDLAPNDQLETGLSTLNRERVLVRMDKLYRDEDILQAIESLGPLRNTIVCIDMPKSLSIPGRWRQEEVKMHPLRLKRQNGDVISRFDKRGYKLADALEQRGALVLMYFHYWARVNYDMLVPFRSRSPHGCRALQAAIEHQLGITNLPSNLAASSVLESMVGAYVSWSVWAGEAGRDYEVYKDESGHKILLPKGRPHLRPKAAIKTDRRRFRVRPVTRRGSRREKPADTKPETIETSDK